MLCSEHDLAGCSYKGWLAGAQLSLDTSKTAKALLAQTNFAVGYADEDFTIHAAVSVKRFNGLVCSLVLL